MDTVCHDVRATSGASLTRMQWIPEGSGKHSQSVVDLFEFIRGSAQVILSELPLSEYKRAVYTVDLSRASRL